jgi:hypothetical protein
LKILKRKETKISEKIIRKINNKNGNCDELPVILSNAGQSYLGKLERYNQDIQAATTLLVG